MSNLDIIITTKKNTNISPSDNKIYLQVEPSYRNYLPKELDNKLAFTKLDMEVIWPSKNDSEFFSKHEIINKKIIHTVFIGPHKKLEDFLIKIENNDLNIKTSQLKSLYGLTFFSQIHDEDTYRWLSTSHEVHCLTFLKRVKDIATSLNIFNNLKKNELYFKNNWSKILINSSATKYAYEKGYNIILSSINSPVYTVERTEHLELISNRKSIKIKFTNKLGLQNPIHAIIGKNGSGKSYHLKEYLKSYFKNYEESYYSHKEVFSRIILVSNTVHDKDYTPSKICRDRSKRSNYHFISNTSLKHYNNIHTQGYKITLNSCIEDIIFREITRSGFFNKANISDEVLEMINLNFDISVNSTNLGSKIDNVRSVSEALDFFKQSNNKYSTNSFNINDINTEINFISGDRITDLSSGQITFLIKTLSILMTIETNSIVIIEEPENFLHPSLLIKFMRILKKILNETNSCSIIATHSPLVLRELPKEQVTIFSRFDNITSHRNPTIETFGADATELFQESFSDLETKASFRDTIREIAKSERSVSALLDKYSHLPTSLLTKIINEWKRK